jgi:hypothetical protein
VQPVDVHDPPRRIEPYSFPDTFQVFALLCFPTTSTLKNDFLAKSGGSA